MNDHATRISALTRSQARRRSLALLGSLAFSAGLIGSAAAAAAATVGANANANANANATAAAMAAPSATAYEVVHHFTGGAGGSSPSSLMFASDGTLYGVAQTGGGQRRGAIFRMRAGSFDIAHSFLPNESGLQDWDQGKLDPLAEGPDGAIYGTTYDGGDHGQGLAYRLAADGALTYLHHFSGGADGASPNDELTVGADGALYGTAATAAFGSGLPSAYRMTLDGSVTPLAQIGTWLNGLSRLTLASDGNFYSMSQLGGAWSHGGAHRIAPDGSVTPVYSVAFDLPSVVPSGGFVQHADGYLYGTTENDPEGRQNGTAFRMSLAGKVRILHRFQGPEGRLPYGLIVGRDGGLYGATTAGGPSGYGVVYRLGTDGSYTVLHAFERFEYPVGRLAQGPDGRLYGVTRYGTSGFGSIYAVVAAGRRAAKR